MKKFLIGALILISSTVAFGKFEKQLGYKVVTKSEDWLCMENIKNKGCLGIFTHEQGNRFTADDLHGWIEQNIKDKECTISDAGDNYVVVKVKGHMPTLFINNGKHLIVIDIPSDKHLKVADRYLKLNNISTTSTDWIISDICLKLELEALKKKFNR